MAATPKPVRKRHKATEIKMAHALKKHKPEKKAVAMKEHRKEMKETKSKFKALGGKY